MKCIYIYNPNSGKGKSEKNRNYIVERLKTKYDIVDTYATTAPKDMTVKLKEIANDYNTVVFSGGDGTFNEVVNALAPLEKKPSLGYIPTGTCNDVARTLKIPRTIKKAVQLILNGEVKSVDCMRVNERYAMYVVCAGVLTKSTYSTPQNKKKSWGKIAYVYNALLEKNKVPTFHIQAYNWYGDLVAETDCILILIMNSKSIAGMRVNKHASLVDGQVEVAMIKTNKPKSKRSKIMALLAIAKMFLFGYRIKEKRIVRIKGDYFEFKTDENVVWNYDGEKGEEGNVIYSIVPKAIDIILKKNIKNI